MALLRARHSDLRPSCEKEPQAHNRPALENNPREEARRATAGCRGRWRPHRSRQGRRCGPGSCGVRGGPPAGGPWLGAAEGAFASLPDPESGGGVPSPRSPPPIPQLPISLLRLALG